MDTIWLSPSAIGPRFIVVWDAVVIQGASDGFSTPDTALKSILVMNLPSCPYTHKEWTLPLPQFSLTWIVMANVPLWLIVTQFPAIGDWKANNRSSLIILTGVVSGTCVE